VSVDAESSAGNNEMQRQEDNVAYESDSTSLTPRFSRIPHQMARS